MIGCVRAYILAGKTQGGHLWSRERLEGGYILAGKTQGGSPMVSPYTTDKGLGHSISYGSATVKCLASSKGPAPAAGWTYRDMRVWRESKRCRGE